MPKSQYYKTLSAISHFGGHSCVAGSGADLFGGQFGWAGTGAEWFGL
jgi:hypothetical protein